MASIMDLERMFDSGSLAGGVTEISGISGPGAMAVTAVRTSGGRLRLISWQLNTAGPVTRLGDSGNAAGEASHIDLALGARWVTACRTGAGRLRLISWDIDATGAFITRAGDSGDLAGNATLIKIVSLAPNLFVTACRLTDGTLRLISWTLNADGSFARLADSGNLAGTISEISLLRTAADRVVTSVRTSAGRLRLISWSVSAAGDIRRLGDSANLAGTASRIRSVLDSNGFVITSCRTGTGALRLISWRVSAAGAFTRLGDSGNQASTISQNSLAVLPDGVVSAVSTSSGNLRLIAWGVDAAGAFTRRGDSASQAGESTNLVIAPGPGVLDANGHSVTLWTAVRTSTGRLRMISWGPSVVRLHFKVLTNPFVPIATMLTSMQQVYGSVGISVVQATNEALNLPLLATVDVGPCTLGNTTTEQQQLMANRNNVGANDVAVYFVTATNPPFNGCAAHPAGRPSAVVAQGATRWTMAHEVGHVLGLIHVDDTDRLMTGGGTGGITNLPPDLVHSEQSTMIGSPLTVML